MWWDILTAKIVWPWNNLDCLGLKGRTFYMDVFLHPYVGCFVMVFGKTRAYYRLHGFKLVKREG